MERRKKKNWYSLCQRELSQSQVLSCHIKDMHKDKKTCLYCSSFKGPQGRPSIYRNHLLVRHFQSPSSKFDREVNRHLRKREASGVGHQSSPSTHPTSLFFSLSPWTRNRLKKLRVNACTNKLRACHSMTRCVIHALRRY